MIKAALGEISKESLIKSLKEVSEVNIKDLPLKTMDLVEDGSLEVLEYENQLSELNVKKLNTINSHLEGDVHFETGVPYEKDIVRLSDGSIIEGVFPVFKSEFDVQLPKDLHLETDRKQMTHCNEQLKNSISVNPELKSQFSERQIEQIEAGYRPEGYTWHHHQQEGRMQLVNSSEHNNSGHTGGKSIWGGGSVNR